MCSQNIHPVFSSIPSTLYSPVFPSPCILQYSLHPVFSSIPSTLYSPVFPPTCILQYSIHPVFFSIHSILYSPVFPPPCILQYSLNPIFSSIPSTLYSAEFPPPCIPQYSLHPVFSSISSMSTLSLQCWRIVWKVESTSFHFDPYLIDPLTLPWQNMCWRRIILFVFSSSQPQVPVQEQRRIEGLLLPSPPHPLRSVRLPLLHIFLFFFSPLVQCRYRRMNRWRAERAA